MAILKYRLRRWNGITFDTFHLETDSSLITDFVPSVKDIINNTVPAIAISDTEPSTLKNGDFWIGPVS